MARRLLITDDYESPAFAAASQSGGEGSWDVFLVGGSPDWFRWQHPGHARLLHGAELIDAKELEQAAHELVRRYVMSLSERLPKTDLGGRSLLQLLDGPHGNAWWYLEPSERGAYRTPFIGQLYRLALVHLAAERRNYSHVWLSIRETALARVFSAAQRPDWTLVAARRESRAQQRRLPFVRLFLQQCRAFSSFVALRLFVAWLREPLPSHRGGRWVFTAFPTWFTRTHTDAPADRFFTHLGDASIAGYLALLLEPVRMWKHRVAVRAAVRNLRLVPLHRFLRLREALSAFAWRRYRWLWSFRRRMGPRLREQFLGFPVETLVVEDIERALSGAEAIQDEWLAQAVDRAVGLLAPSLVLYRAEFQPAESAVAHGIGRRALAIGYQHHPFSWKYLQMQFTDRQVADSLAVPRQPRARPLPDGFVAIGPALADHVIEGGYPADRVRVCGPQRYGHLLEYRRSRAGKAAVRQALRIDADAFVVVVALAIVESDTQALFGALVGGASEIRGMRLFVRTHPNRPAGDPALAAALDALGRDRAQLMPADARIYDYISAADCMVCVGSMIAFEAMALDVMPIVVDNPGAFGAISLAEYRDSLFVVQNAAELNRAITAVRDDGEEVRSRRRSWPGTLAAVMGNMERPLGPQLDAALDFFDARS
ncbi:MAG: hypothetical protein AMXMBFR57_16610 [Acidimicrobiia bacterium]